MKHIFIIGCKGIPAQYGGFESFVENLTGRAVNSEIKYHVACMGERQERFSYHNADCFRIAVPGIGPAKAVWYDVAAFHQSIKIMKEEGIRELVVYVLACRIGPFAGYFKRKLARFGGKLYVNPDGHEFLRAKWNALIRKYWKFSEAGMVKHADLIICDSKNMERYIQTEYKSKAPATVYIAYGTEESPRKADGEKLQDWYKKHGLCGGEYYLVVGRFVPENNYETIIREFMRTDTKKRLVFITNAEQNKFYGRLQKNTHFTEDPRIVFAGTVYDGELLAQIRAGAYGYLHGHEVGGTNPSLLEALAATELNLLLDVGFNREVAEDSALYWNKEPGNLAKLIGRADRMTAEQRRQLGESAGQRMRRLYGWNSIVEQYERLFLSEGGTR